MPEISRFFGIVIRMYYSEHAPPHFHASYGGEEASIAIGTHMVLAGRLSVRALGLVTEWAGLHESELLTNWREMRAEQAPRRIAPLT